MTESTGESGNGEESLADTEADMVEIAKGNGEEEPLSDTEPDDGQLQEGDEGD